MGRRLPCKVSPNATRRGKIGASATTSLSIRFRSIFSPPVRPHSKRSAAVKRGLWLRQYPSLVGLARQALPYLVMPEQLARLFGGCGGSDTGSSLPGTPRRVRDHRSLEGSLWLRWGWRRGGQQLRAVSAHLRSV